MLPHPEIYRAIKADYARSLHGAAVTNTHGPRPLARFAFVASLAAAPVVRIRRRRRLKLAYRRAL